MDEPTANLDPESAKTVRDFLLELKKEKRTIFLNTHNLDEAQRICDRIGILNTKLMAVGTPEGLERSVGGRKTVIQLKQVTGTVLKALKELSVGEMVNDDKRLTIEVVNPENENPGIVRAVVGAGGEVQSVSVVGSTLEDAYLNLVREKK
jgi:ABC-2 type transport system ATP-binding protein